MQANKIEISWYLYILNIILQKRKTKQGWLEYTGQYRTGWMVSFSRGAIKLNFTAVLFNNVVLSTNFIK